MLGFDKLDFLVSILYVYDMNKCKIYMGTPPKMNECPKKGTISKGKELLYLDLFGPTTWFQTIF